MQKSVLTLSVFQTPLGWLGALGQNSQLLRIHIGRPDRHAAIEAFEEEYTGADFQLKSWDADLEHRLRQFACGEPTDFSDVRLAWPRPLSRFRQRVIRETRRIGWGETVSYGELAARSGSPRAARAVGSTMATNRFPIVVPCHRVVSASDLGGFTAPTGVSLKHQLLTMEGAEATL